MATKPLFASVGLFFHAGAILLLFFIILGGIKDATPLNQFYWFQADTSAIQGAQPITRWTLWGMCGVDANSKNTNCTANKPDFPFDPINNFNTQNGVPNDFIVNRDVSMTLIIYKYWTEKADRFV
jgi:hypothetical protein